MRRQGSGGRGGLRKGRQGEGGVGWEGKINTGGG
jgi:hypothetical protein